MPGASRLLAAADARCWAVSIVTSNGSELARRWLEETELKKYVVSVVGQEMVSQAKPAPDLYLYALALSGCCREGSIAVEDSPAGALAALGAGIRTCFVGAPPEALAGASLSYIEDLSILAQWLADGTIDLHDRCASR